MTELNGFKLIKEETTTTTIHVKMEEGELKNHLYELYKMIWLESCYDPDTEETRQFAKKLLPHIQALNKVLKFNL